MLSRVIGFVCLGVSAAAAAGPGNASISPAASKFFESEVRPLLAEKCLHCHGPDEQNGDVRLDSMASIDAAGLIAPHEPDDSFLIEVVSDAGYDMPPDGALSDQQIGVLRKWVSIGAPWPGHEGRSPNAASSIFDDEDRSWWAIQPLHAASEESTLTSMRRDAGATTPMLSTQMTRRIDQRILAAMADKGLSPASITDRESLIRRITIDLTGLPPTPDQVDTFLADQSSDAYARLVDRLLDSRAYGEHQARWWLDLVRYAESDGYRADGFRPDAWRYRDYVIDSFASDKPYDRFVQEQLAADELFPDDLDARVGLGYLRHWVYEWNIRDARTQWKTIMEDLTDTTADAFLGLGLQCAKCHNHKFDPLLQKDYFRLRGFFEAFLPVEDTLADDEAIAAHAEALSAWEAETAELQHQIEQIEAPYRNQYRDVAIDRFPPDLRTIARRPVDQKSPHDVQLSYLVQRQIQAEYDRLDRYMTAEDKERVIELRRKLQQHHADKPAGLPRVMSVTDVGPIAPPTVMPRGGVVEVQPGVPSIIDPEPMPVSYSGATTGRRAALARWITDDGNPLTGRVIANRIWQSMFGRGLAANPSDFGLLGGPPSHPRLLDDLVVYLRSNDWRLKTLHRAIALSETYRRGTEHENFEQQQEIDPDNVYYWRSDTRRLTAEQIRDSLLVVTGRLEPKLGGPSVAGDSDHRSIYVRVERNSPDRLLNGFDLPQFFTSHSVRNTTTTPLQSLMLINSDQLLSYARSLAIELESDSANPRQQIELAWKRVFGRPPSKDEIDAAVTFLHQQSRRIGKNEDGDSEGLVETSSLPYRDGQAIRLTTGKDRLRLSAPHDAALSSTNLTIEAFFELRSIASTGAVRTLLSKWDGTTADAGWRFGITGEGSRRKPRTLVVQMVGRDGQRLTETAVFSDHHIDLNTPYYAAAVFPAGVEPGRRSIKFYLKDLSNDDEQLSVVEVEYDHPGPVHNESALLLGSRGGPSPQPFDGLIDDVRVTADAINTGDILYQGEKMLPSAVAWYRFEAASGVLANAARPDRPLRVSGASVIHLDADQAALADLCHSLLNANEFLYRD